MFVPLIQVILCNILRHIDEDLGGEFPYDISALIQYYEIGPKTASLFLWLSQEEESAIPVDSHVFKAFTHWGWAMASNPNEVCYQTTTWFKDKFGTKRARQLFIPINDAIGSIRQTIQSSGMDFVRAKVEDNGFEDILEMVLALEAP